MTVNADVATDARLGSRDENVAALVLGQRDVRSEILPHAVGAGSVLRLSDRRLVLSQGEGGVGVILVVVGEEVGGGRKTSEGWAGWHGDTV
jgi:hypothetical protein